MKINDCFQGFSYCDDGGFKTKTSHNFLSSQKILLKTLKQLQLDRNFMSFIKLIEDERE